MIPSSLFSPSSSPSLSIRFLAAAILGQSGYVGSEHSLWSRSSSNLNLPFLLILYSSSLFKLWKWIWLIWFLKLKSSVSYALPSETIFSNSSSWRDFLQQRKKCRNTVLFLKKYRMLLEKLIFTCGCDECGRSGLLVGSSSFGVTVSRHFYLKL